MKRFVCFCAVCLAALACITVLDIAEEANIDVVSVNENQMADYGSCDVHTYPDEYTVVTAATCSSTGMQYRTCTICGYKEIVTTSKNPNNHSSVSSGWFFETTPTCSSTGIKYHVCYGCNAHVDETVAEIDPEAHLAEGEYEEITPATCGSTGIKAYKCKYCGKYFGEVEIPVNPNNHVTSDESKWVLTKVPTCAENGEMACYCDICGEIAKTKIIPATGAHDWDTEWTIDSEPTCSSSGSKSHHCLQCGQTMDVTEIPPVTGVHTFSDEFTTDIEATCVSPGEKSRHCVYCDERTDITEIPISPENHKFGEEWIVTREASCTQTGLKHNVCIYCSTPSVDVIIPKTEHQYSDKYEILSESADGLSAKVKYTCQICGEEYITVISYENNKDEGKKLLELSSDSILKVDNSLMFVSNLARRMSASELKSNFENSSLFTLFTNEDTYASELQQVGTGFYLQAGTSDGVVTVYTISVTGDVDSDGDVTASDARKILRSAAGIDTLSGIYAIAADVDGNGNITSADARKALRVAAAIDYIESTYKN